MPGDLLRPSGRGRQVRYTNAGKLSGTAYDRDGNVHGGMGIDWGDYDSDGKLDLFVGTFQNETKSLYHNDGGGSFTDMGIPTGIGAAAGAVLEARLADPEESRKLVRQCQTGGSYMSASDPRVHFGLGDAAKIETLTSDGRAAGQIPTGTCPSTGTSSFAKAARRR